MQHNSKSHSHGDHIDSTVATSVDDLCRPISLARLRSCFLSLPAEIRAKIYFYICKDMSINVSLEVTRAVAVEYSQHITNVMLSCRTAWLEMPPVVSDAVAVHIHTRELLGLDSQAPEGPLALQSCHPIFRHTKNVVGHWRPDYIRPQREGFPTASLKPTLPSDAVQWSRFGWKNIKMVLKISVPIERTVPLGSFEATVTEQVNKFCNARDFVACVPNVGVGVEINIWWERLRCYVGKAVVRHNGVDMKMWRVAFPAEAEVVKVLLKAFGISESLNGI